MVPDFKVAAFDGFVVVVIQGTSTADQRIGQALPDTQSVWPLGDGHVSSFYLLAASALYAQLKPILDLYMAGRQAVVIGHSYGGALATLIGPMIDRDWPAGRATICTFGAVKSGDPTFAASYASNLVNVQGELDLLCSFPPGLTLTFLATLGNTTPLVNGGSWAHAGRSFRLGLAGEVYALDTERTYDTDAAAWAAVDQGSDPLGVKNHSIIEYVARLRRRVSRQYRQTGNAFGWDFAKLDLANLAIASAYGTRFQVIDLD